MCSGPGLHGPALVRLLFSRLDLKTRFCATCTNPPHLPAALIQSLVTSITGAGLECDAGGACGIFLEGLPVSKLDATCQAGECLVPTNATLDTTEGAQSLSPPLVVIVIDA